MARGPAYSGSKTALITQGEAWRAALAADGISVSVACPGYVRTAMTARHESPLPFLIEAEEAARRILAGIEAGRRRILFPWQLRLGAWIATA